MDHVIEALKVSGPVGGLVVVLGLLVKLWITQMRGEAKETTSRIFELLGAVKAEIDQIKSVVVADLRERVARLEENAKLRGKS